MALWKNGEFVSDAYQAVPDDAPLPDGPAVVPLARFLAERDALLARNTPVGVQIQPADRVEALAPDLERLPLLVVAFPKFADGRGFSQARLVRERFGFKGELRAVGDILFDRIAYMQRCGFDSLDIVNEPTLAALRAGQVPVSHQHYQPTGQDAPDRDALRPWRRRA